MKFGPRKPSLKKSFKARTTGRAKRAFKRSYNPLYGKKGMGLINNPKKYVYNKVYNKTTFDVFKGFKYGLSSTKKSKYKPKSQPVNDDTELLIKEMQLSGKVTFKKKENWKQMLIFGIMLIFFSVLVFLLVPSILVKFIGIISFISGFITIANSLKTFPDENEAEMYILDKKIDILDLSYSNFYNQASNRQIIVDWLSNPDEYPNVELWYCLNFYSEKPKDENWKYTINFPKSQSKYFNNAYESARNKSSSFIEKNDANPSYIATYSSNQINELKELYSIVNGWKLTKFLINNKEIDDKLFKQYMKSF